ncbi:hypothetical protein GCM10009678_42780 [Actinomadura kijaniata]|uniref:Uncharacterized protein n=1 Tax=Actinomadura namibiensis TaxID=182080 RepID=A0A7W3LU91_ACTNM|nr:CU044_5270 family protein [Actinomadura namibiensis]MBA8954330.1 hypothetical protein [Actinomadura namibiensis]
MDEMTELRRFRSAVPVEPLGERQTERVFAEFHAPSSRARARRIWTRRRSLGLGVLVAAGAAASVAVVPLGDEKPERPTGPPSPQMLLIAAAERAERDLVRSGAFWHQRFRETRQYWARGRNGERYVIEDRRITELWTPTRNPDSAVISVRELGAGPATPADRAAWQRAGSPSDWPIGNGMRLKAKPDRRQPVVRSQRGRGGFRFMGEPVTLAELQRLPADPQGLRTLILRGRKQAVDTGRAPRENGPSEAETVFLETSVLLRLPAPPRTRGAAYRLIASLPGLRYEGRARDPLGRPGPAVDLPGGRAATGADEMSGVTRRLIVDPKTSHLLAWQDHTTGSRRQLVTSTAYESIGWTDTPPPRG